MTEFLPNLPLDCLDLSRPERVGLACAGCPMREIGCTALAAGEHIAELEKRNAEHEQDNTLLVERLFSLRIDSLVEEAFTPEGLKDIIDYETDISEELKQLNWGVVRLDGRFVKYINTFGNTVGDSFLQHGGSEIAAITDGLVRTRNRRVQPLEVNEDHREGDRRAGYSLGGDIICRQGGDEFSLIIRNVDNVQLTRIAARIQSQLTVSGALGSYEDGKVPFIASVGSCHASEISPVTRVALEERDDLWATFRDVNGQADEGQRQSKGRQYTEMWNLTVSAMDPAQRTSYINQPDDAEVAKLFLAVLCPEFKERPHKYLAGKGKPTE
jgi:GGDEF domain-containing protein